MVMEKREVSDIASEDRRSLNDLSNGFSSPSECNEASRLSLIQISAEKRAKKIRFYRNGDRFFGGVLLAVSLDHYRSWDSLLAALSSSALTTGAGALTSGVRHVYTVRGARVTEVAQLEVGCHYVCAGTEPFRQLHYGALLPPAWSGARRPCSIGRALVLSSPLQSPSTPTSQDSNTQVMSGGPMSRQLQLLSESGREFVRPKLISVVRCGCRPRRVVRFLLNRRTAHSVDQVLQELSLLVKLDSGSIKRLLDSQGNEIRDLADFFSDQEVFFAYGPEKHRVDDFELHPEEVKWVAGRSHARRQAGCLFSERPAPHNYRDAAAHSGATDQYCNTMATPSARRRRQRARKSLKAESQPAVCPLSLRNHYWLGRKIGDGNFAVVYQCFKRSSGDAFAVKIIDTAKCVGKEHMIDNEVSILRRVQHANIIRLVERVDCPEESSVCLVMELVERGDLFDAISVVTRYSEREVSFMLHDLASALLYLHRLSIVHRDVKPENLLLFRRADGAHSVKLADFGLAQHVTAPLFAVCGTPTYVAPEILAGTGYGLQVDVWAAGVITYILLCGFPPFAAVDNNQEELFDQILSGNFEFIAPYWDNISELSCQLIAAMLQVDPDARFTAEDILSHPWISESGVGEGAQLKNGGGSEAWDIGDDCLPRVSSLSSARSLPCISSPDHVVLV